jgi:hypothetical protein
MEQETFNRMVTEFEELNEKTNKLRDFLLTKVNKVPIDNLNRDLLISQLKAMEAYQGILSIRIGLNNQEGWLDKSTPEISNNKSDNETTAEDISNTKDTKITENTNEVSE